MYAFCFHSQLCSRLTSVQSELISLEPRLKAAAVSMAKLHITLMVMTLDTDDSIERYALLVCPYVGIEYIL